MILLLKGVALMNTIIFQFILIFVVLLTILFTMEQNCKLKFLLKRLKEEEKNNENIRLILKVYLRKNDKFDLSNKILYNNYEEIKIE